MAQIMADSTKQLRELMLTTELLAPLPELGFQRFLYICPMTMSYDNRHQIII